VDNVPITKSLQEVGEIGMWVAARRRKLLPMSKPLEILVVNDDGISAPGILALIEAVEPFGNLTICAPDKPQSGMGHAISVGKPLRLTKHRINDKYVGYACNGTPADCVKLATGVLHHRPDLVVSGVNHGVNSSLAVFYSGTISAAMEGAIEGIPAIAFSLADYSLEADFSACQVVIKEVVAKAIAKRIPHNTILNVNIPKLPIELIKGIKVARQAIGRWIEEFDERTDPYGHKYYWLTGKFQLDDQGEDTDEHALAGGYVSIVPVQLDVTAHFVMPELNTWSLSLPKSE
jgi:5'-nucleotidase